MPTRARSRTRGALPLAAHKLFGVDANTLYPELVDKNRQFVYVQRFADPKAAAAFLKNGFNGIGSYPEERRIYPQDSVAAQVVGYAGTDNQGLGGLEVQYNRTLAGRPGVADGRPRSVRPGDRRRSAARRERDGHADRHHARPRDPVERRSVLRDTVARWRARSATAVILDPRNGEVLALAQAPGYDANKANRVPFAIQRNTAVTDMYEPGSVFKLVTIAGALSTGIVTPTSTFRLPYSIHVADRVVHDAEYRPTETMSVAKILSHSSNVGAITIAQRLGAPALMEWINRFGFGQKTGVDFPGESPGAVLPLDKWSGSTIGNVPIGQGVDVTPIQMAAAYAAVANDGVWVQPHLVQRIGERAVSHVKRRRVVSRAVDRELKAMLTNVVDEHGATGTAAAIPGYTVAGKTGTAQLPGPHGYTTGQYVASFVGMVPVEKPRLLVLVVVDEPRGDIFGGQVAAPAFAQIAKFDLQYLAVPPNVRVTPPS